MVISKIYFFKIFEIVWNVKCQFLQYKLSSKKMITLEKELELEKTNPKVAVEKTIDFLSESINKKKIRIEIDLQNDTYIYGIPVMFETLIRNLLINAIKFSYEGGTIIISNQTVTRI